MWYIVIYVPYTWSTDISQFVEWSTAYGLPLWNSNIFFNFQDVILDAIPRTAEWSTTRRAHLWKPGIEISSRSISGKLIITFYSALGFMNSWWRWREVSNTFNLAGIRAHNPSYCKRYAHLKSILSWSHAKT